MKITFETAFYFLIAGVVILAYLWAVVFIPLSWAVKESIEKKKKYKKDDIFNPKNTNPIVKFIRRQLYIKKLEVFTDTIRRIVMTYDRSDHDPDTAVVTLERLKRELVYINSQILTPDSYDNAIVSETLKAVSQATPIFKGMKAMRGKR